MFFPRSTHSDFELLGLAAATKMLKPEPKSLEIFKDFFEIPAEVFGKAIVKHWYVINRDDFPAITSSIAKVLFLAMRKYGVNARAYLAKIVTR